MTLEEQRNTRQYCILMFSQIAVEYLDLYPANIGKPNWFHFLSAPIVAAIIAIIQLGALRWPVAFYISDLEPRRSNGSLFICVFPRNQRFNIQVIRDSFANKARLSIEKFPFPCGQFLAQQFLDCQRLSTTLR